ncbi:mitochondrial carrier protein, 4 transmembrane domain [Cryptosporidium parvum Iowa II]|uniref:Mitochondrial carrier protein, 4 transmembrane domain n=2 Tax=Cryptosporidium parvum TaxID=5807 RepID=Q5CX62_CRYPI|nr:mitochondrial carrier protein, 4 transmembrane domain [Cryptosporidium parvum Iowa II]QOY41116.1 Mitochondrial carrier protein [Cryptosporidium parvum]WKS78344.1 mitochondrial carrier protein [Cryptosporidium sp. 43IA8]EAK89885.1 mitochondrial carrier protein, 4 transmembrane domain [Cryptosporidium parvum Iowa II]WRK32835.1 Mitochondrial carrier protein [Cryptosporidium parvum]CAD98526.1 mitochondrial carrier protein, possible [Cryptosporidium parvum]|eukprot:QOY41116.1 hypothetical protein CPATCC_002767 [Cryptosporidium parvum]
MENGKKSFQIVVNSLISGGIAGLFVETILYPVDAIKTKMQYRSLCKNSVLFFSTRNYYRHIYSGFKYSAFGSFISSSIFFGTFHFLSNYSPQVKYKSLKTMQISLISELLSSLFRAPFEVIKQNIQVRNKSFLGHFYTNYSLFRHCLNFNKITASLIRDIPFSIIQFSLWEKLNRTGDGVLGEKCNFKDLLSGISGGISGAIAALITSPADNIRTYIFTKAKTRSSNVSILSAIKTIYGLNGIKSFYIGSFLRALWLTIGGIIYFGCYQLCNSALEKMYHSFETLPQ